ncbi:MAG: ECF transporter S component [Wujia sp.]
MTNIKEHSRSYAMPKLSVGMQSIATVGAVIAAVLIPQALHLLGKATGTASALGEVFLPMHLPVLLVGILAGAYAGAATGLLAPIISYLLTGMPGAVLLPFMTIELAVYGLTIGLLRNVRMFTVFKVLLAQIAGRAVRALAIVLAVYVFETSSIAPAIIWTSIRTGIAGILIQLVLIPIVVYFVRKAENHEQESA